MTRSLIDEDEREKEMLSYADAFLIVADDRNLVEHGVDFLSRSIRQCATRVFSVSIDSCSMYAGIVFRVLFST